MNLTYKFRYKRFFTYRTEVVVGHQYVSDQQKMCLYYADGSVKEIKKWIDCEVFLGVDWVNATKEQIKREAGKEL